MMLSSSRFSLIFMGGWRNVRVIVTVVFVTFVLFIYFADYLSLDNNVLTSARKWTLNQSNEKIEKLPLILEATKFHKHYYLSAMASFDFPFFPPGCPVRCRVSENISDYAEADVALFHLRKIQLATLKLPVTNPYRLNVLYSYEAPANEHLNADIPKDFFNLTLTYSSLSNLTDWNDAFDRVEADDDSSLFWTDEEIDAVVANKTQVALMITSHCRTHSGRELLVEEIRKLTNLTLLGKCYSNQTCDKTCFHDNIEKSFFYLAFENAVCPDYVTEKFWHLKQLAVPVVLKRSIVGSQVDGKYFLAVDDFPSVTALVDKLVWYSQNLDAYKKFFGWSKKYRKTYKKWNLVCDLCQLAHQRARHQISDVHEWWHGYRNRCEIRDFASHIFKTSNVSV